MKRPACQVTPNEFTYTAMLATCAKAAARGEATVPHPLCPFLRALLLSRGLNGHVSSLPPY